MGRGKKNKAKTLLQKFVEEIPDEKLIPPFRPSAGPIYASQDFRLDMQCESGTEQRLSHFGQNGLRHTCDSRLNSEELVKNSVFHQPAKPTGFDRLRNWTRGSKANLHDASATTSGTVSTVNSRRVSMTDSRRVGMLNLHRKRSIDLRRVSLENLRRTRTEDLRRASLINLHLTRTSETNPQKASEGGKGGDHEETDNVSSSASSIFSERSSSVASSSRSVMSKSDKLKRSMSKFGRSLGKKFGKKDKMKKSES
ncbi:hypothetical protein BDZ91DRAFT_798394 [Kalaharituber pfeilii]|nr:hypothetical protein BDZ91DRAFT_798394 [Kalaharituber pfeilii]